MHRSLLLLAGSLIAAVALVAPVPSKGQADPPEPDGPKKPKVIDPGAVEVRFTDGSTMKLTIKEEKIEAVSPYGKLQIPVAEVRTIEFRTRVPDDVAKRIEAAIANLGSPEFQKREDATAELGKLGIRAYPALLKAAKSNDREVRMRAERLLERLR